MPVTDGNSRRTALCDNGGGCARGKTGFRCEPNGAARRGSGQHLGQMAGELDTEFLHAGSLLFV
jgi:hypothetical protein